MDLEVVGILPCEASCETEYCAEFERYDTYSAVALGAMQVGIGVFAIRLVLR